MPRPLLVLMLMLILPTRAAGQNAPVAYDIVIRNGRVLDGAGNPWVSADVAVRAGRIVRVGLVRGAGRREIDATGMYVAPGFIDMMDQSGSVLPRNGLAENKLRMGVTSAIGGEAGAPVPVDSIEEAAAEIDAARDRGVDVAADLYPYTAGGTGLEATIPSWVFDGGADSMRTRIARPDVRAQLKRQVETGYDGWWNIVEAAGGWDGIVLVNARNEDNAHFEGKSLTTIAREWGKDPADAAWDLVAQGNGRVMAIYHMMSEDDVQWALQRPWTSIGSDAGAALSAGSADVLGLPHPRSYGTFPRILARYVRETGTLSLEEAVRKMTSWPATRMGLERRGLIREGAWADITVFDLGRVRDRATYEEPVLFPEGIEYVLVNGVVVIEDGGKHTGARPGHVLYGPGRETNR